MNTVRAAAVQVMPPVTEIAKFDVSCHGNEVAV